MTDEERREILAEMTVEEIKRVVRATMRKHGPDVTKTQVVEAAVRAADVILRESGAVDMTPVGVDIVMDPARRSKKHALLLLSGPLFGDVSIAIA